MTKFSIGINGGMNPTNAAVLQEAEIRVLSALGFMAARSGQLIPCLRIFEALTLLRPGKAFPYIGMAIGYLAVNMASTAVELLQSKALPVCEDDSEIHLYLSLALFQSGQSVGAMRLLDSWKEVSGDFLKCNSLARRLCELIEANSRSDRLPVPASVVGLD